MTPFTTTVPRALLLFGAVLFAVSLALPQTTYAQCTTFTYQGYLEEGGTPAQGDKDLRFSLYDSQSGGSQMGQTITKQGAGVTDSVFSVELAFGAAFAEATRYLEVVVRDASSSGSFTRLTPREPVRPAPIASSLPNVTVDANGNVGIGTTSPGNRLTVDGTIESASGGLLLPDGTNLKEAGGLGVSSNTNGAHDLSGSDYAEELPMRPGATTALAA